MGKISVRASLSLHQHCSLPSLMSVRGTCVSVILACVTLTPTSIVFLPRMASRLFSAWTYSTFVSKSSSDALAIHSTNTYWVIYSVPGAVRSSQDTGRVSKVSAYVLEVQGQQSEHRRCSHRDSRRKRGPRGTCEQPEGSCRRRACAGQGLGSARAHVTTVHGD